MLGLEFTGANTTNSLMTINFKVPGADNQASSMHIVAVSQQVIEIGETGVTILD